MLNRAATLLDRVDARDQPIGTVRRKDALQPGVGFRVVHVLLVDEKGHLALQEIADSHDRHPGWWGSSVAGYVKAGESYEAAAQRKLADEAGLLDIPLTDLGRTQMKDEGATKFIAVFLARTTRDALRPNPADFRGVEFESIREIQQQLVSGSRNFTPTFHTVMRYALPKLRALIP